MTERSHNPKVDRTNADRLYIPNSPACGEWETLLVDAMDGALRPEDESTFSNHMATCASCTEMFEQVRRGREWLEFLAPEPAVPAGLLTRILADTGHGLGKITPPNLAVAGMQPGAIDIASLPPVWQQPGFAAGMRRFAEPRLLMTAAMAFFSIALTLSMTGVRISSLHMADLRPTAVRSILERRIMTASTPIVRYYDHLRFVYEVESRMKELRRSSETEKQSQQESQPAGQKSSAPDGDGVTHRKDGGTKLNPNDAPQQTVNPPVSLWGGDPLEAALDTSDQPGPGSNKYAANLQATNQARNTIAITKGVPTRIDRSGLVEADLVKTFASAKPDRSKPCLA